MDVRHLVGLFPPDLPQRYTLRVTCDDVPAVLRACSYLRLRLRRTDLLAISDADLERANEIESLKNRTDVAWLSFLFLSTIQLIVLKHFPARSRKSWFSAMKELLQGLRGSRVRSNEPGRPEVVPVTQLVVLNDPVNLMPYVTYVLQAVVGLSAGDAERHMRAVHEQQRSVVWQGSREQAEELLCTLRTWHLGGELHDVVEQDDSQVHST